MVTCKGISNECEDGRHVLFFDWDNYLLPKVEAECRRLQEKYKLTDIIILKTSDPFNFAGVCLKKVSWTDLRDILKDTHCDPAFINKHFAFKCDIQRYTNKGKIPKPVFVEIISSQYKTGEHSLAHAFFFSRMYKVPINMNYKYDYSDKVKLQQYKTKVKRKHG